jgi:hypothetical protein
MPDKKMINNRAYYFNLAFFLLDLISSHILMIWRIIMKKILVVLSMVLLGVGLSACGQKAGDSTSTETTTEAAAPAAEEAPAAPAAEEAPAAPAAEEAPAAAEEAPAAE